MAPHVTQALFRREALEAKRAGWLGAILLAQPVRLWLLTASAVAIAALVALFLSLGTYTRRSTVVGQLVPLLGLATVLAPATGVVSRVEVPEGGRVAEGQSLAVVTVPRATLGAGDTQVALEQRLRSRRAGLESFRGAQTRLREARGTGLASQWAVAQRELLQVEAEIATSGQQVRLANETLERLRSLGDRKYVGLLQVKQQESAVLAHTADMQALQRQAIGTRRLIAQLAQAVAELPGQQQATEADHARDLALLEQEQLETQARGALAVVAPLEGLVSALLVKPGQAVQVGQPLLSLLPGDGTLEAELLVPSRAIGFIAPGDEVLLRYQAFPHQKFGHHSGKIARISRSALGPADLGAPNGDPRSGEPLYRVTVALTRQDVLAYGKPEPLKPGMLLDADILGERRRLIEWIFEPLYSLKGKVGGG